MASLKKNHSDNVVTLTEVTADLHKTKRSTVDLLKILIVGKEMHNTDPSAEACGCHFCKSYKEFIYSGDYSELIRKAHEELQEERKEGI